MKAGDFEVELEKEEKKSELEFSTKYLSGWIKIFNFDSRGSGFIRMWDFSPRIITASMLQELLTILKAYCGEKVTASKNPSTSPQTSPN